MVAPATYQELTPTGDCTEPHGSDAKNLGIQRNSDGYPEQTSMPADWKASTGHSTLVDSSYSDLPPHGSDAKRQRIRRNSFPHSDGYSEQTSMPADPKAPTGLPTAAQSSYSDLPPHTSAKRQRIQRNSDGYSEQTSMPANLEAPIILQSDRGITAHASNDDSGIDEGSSDAFGDLSETCTCSTKFSNLSETSARSPKLLPNWPQEQIRFIEQAELLLVYTQFPPPQSHTQFPLLSNVHPSSQKLAVIGRGNLPFAVQIGDAYPSATVVSVDLKLIGKKLATVATNVTPLIDENIYLEWSWPKNSFDGMFIYNPTEWMIKDEIPNFLKQCLRVLKPGCPIKVIWFSWLDIEPVHMWQSVARAGAGRLGVSSPTTDQLKSSGFEAVDTAQLTIPIPKTAHPDDYDLLRAAVKVYSEGFIAGPMNWEPRSVNILSGQVRTELGEGFKLPVVIVQGQKPAGE